MKIPSWHLAVALLSFFVSPNHSFAQGNLTPAGAPTPTMKTLEQIEPRIDVAKLEGDANSHVIITNAGSYYMSTNLEVTKTRGIFIAATGVTLDMNGFEIARISGSGGDGIRINFTNNLATVRNGTIRGFSYGIYSAAKSSLFEKLAVTGCSTFAIHAGGGSTQVLDCRVYSNTGSGIFAENSSIVSGCTALDTQGTYGIFAANGSTISGCTVEVSKGMYGIYGGTGSTITDCTARGNQVTYGIYAENGSIITRCTSVGNIGTGSESYGIYGAGGNTITACVSKFNSNTNSPTTSLQGVGFFSNNGSTIKDCNASDNRGDGIRVFGYCFIVGNDSHANGNGGDGAGIHTETLRNRIEGNTVTNNDRGIDVDSTASLIIRNSAANNTTNYSIAANNSYGTIINNSGGGGAVVNGSSAASTFGTPDAWANFSH